MPDENKIERLPEPQPWPEKVVNAIRLAILKANQDIAADPSKAADPIKIDLSQFLDDPALKGLPKTLELRRRDPQQAADPEQCNQSIYWDAVIPPPKNAPNAPKTTLSFSLRACVPNEALTVESANKDAKGRALSFKHDYDHNDKPFEQTVFERNPDGSFRKMVVEYDRDGAKTAVTETALSSENLSSEKIYSRRKRTFAPPKGRWCVART